MPGLAGVALVEDVQAVVLVLGGRGTVPVDEDLTCIMNMCTTRVTGPMHDTSHCHTGWCGGNSRQANTKGYCRPTAVTYI